MIETPPSQEGLDEFGSYVGAVAAVWVACAGGVGGHADAPGGGRGVVCVAAAVPALRVLVSPCARSAGEEDSRSVGVGAVCDAALAAAPVRLWGLR